MLEIRPATAGDIPATRDLLVSTWHATYDAIYGAEKVADITSRWHSSAALTPQIGQARSTFLNAFIDDSLVGTVFATLTEGGEGFLNRLYVAPNVHGQGVGRALFDAAMVALGHPATTSLEVEPANLGAVAFYERLGFEEAGTVSDCGGDSGVPAIRMCLTQA